MDSVSSTSNSMGPEIFAMKKAMETQAQGIFKMLESAQVPNIASAPSSGASLTGIGQSLDIRA